jgi:hypothetical protein
MDEFRRRTQLLRTTGVVKARQPLCCLNLSNTIFRILEGTAVPSSESVDQFQLVQRAAAIKEASVAAVAPEDGNADENVILTEYHAVVGDRTVDIAAGQPAFRVHPVALRLAQRSLDSG